MVIKIYHNLGKDRGKLCIHWKSIGKEIFQQNPIKILFMNDIDMNDIDIDMNSCK